MEGAQEDPVGAQVEGTQEDPVMEAQVEADQEEDQEEAIQEEDKWVRLDMAGWEEQERDSLIN